MPSISICFETKAEGLLSKDVCHTESVKTIPAFLTSFLEVLGSTSAAQHGPDTGKQMFCVSLLGKFITKCLH